MSAVPVPAPARGSATETPAPPTGTCRGGSPARPRLAWPRPTRPHPTRPRLIWPRPPRLLPGAAPLPLPPRRAPTGAGERGHCRAGRDRPPPARVPRKGTGAATGAAGSSAGRARGSEQAAAGRAPGRGRQRPVPPPPPRAGSPPRLPRRRRIPALAAPLPRGRRGRAGE